MSNFSSLLDKVALFSAECLRLFAALVGQTSDELDSSANCSVCGASGEISNALDAKPNFSESYRTDVNLPKRK